MWSTAGWADTTVTINVAAATGTVCTCTYWPRCVCAWSYPVPSEPPLLRIPRHGWWNLYHRDLHDKIHLPIAAPVSVRVARRLQPGNLHERRMQKRKRYTQRLRVQ